MDGHELRKEPRIPAGELPSEYTSFSVLLAHGKEAQVKTTDVSANGFGFFSNLPSDEFILGGRIVLYPVESQVPVYGQIVHKSVTTQGTRVGVRLIQAGGYHVYHAAISELIANRKTQYINIS